MRALRLLLAFGLLALANLAGSGEAMACDRETTVNMPARSAPEMSNFVPAELRFVVRVASGARHPIQHHHDHGGPDGCCMLCCGVAVPHILILEPVLFLARPGPGAFFISYSTAFAKAAGGLPFRPPRPV